MNPCFVLLLACACLYVESGKSHKFFHAWRSSKAVGVQGAMTGVTLVLGMWRDEEQKAGIVGADGVIANIARPLAGTPAAVVPKVGRRKLTLD